MAVRRTAVVGCLLILSSMPAWTPLLRLTRDALPLVRRPYAEHRAAFNGPFWKSIAEVRRRMPGDGTVPVILRRGRDFDRTLFLGYYLYPRVARYYVSLDHYRAVAPAPPETPIAYIDVERLDAVRVMTYPEIRAEQAAEEPFTPPALSSAPLREAIIPFAVSFDGRPPDSYVTQAAFEGSGPFVLTLNPQGKSAWFVLAPGRPLVFRDLVYEAFHELGSGWIAVRASAPLRAGVSLVNRGRHRGAPIPIFASAPPLPRRIESGEKLWLLNPGGTDLHIFVNGAPVTLPRFALQSSPASAENIIEGNAIVLAFTSQKLPDGNTRFVWP
jgi:hypothetical protein